jgi:hypothetical protein
MSYPCGAIASSIASLLVTLLTPATALAQLSVKASATGQYQYNTNVYDLQAGFPLPGTSDYQRADSYYAYGGELDLIDQISQQNLYVTAAGTQFDYDRFTQLTHDEYRFDGGWNWKLGSDFSGTLDVTRTRTMVAFTEIVQLLLAIQTEQRETAKASFQFLPNWRLDANGFTRNLQEPLPGAPDLQLTESGAGAGLNYGGTVGLTSGLSIGLAHGDYANTNGVLAPVYDQKTAAFVLTYTPSAAPGPVGPNGGAPVGPGGQPVGPGGAPLVPGGQYVGPNGALVAGGPSTFDGAVGYTQRTSPTGIDNLSGLTGHLEYTDQLTGKTSAQLALSRIINSYLTNAGSEIDSSLAAKVLWQMSYKIGLTAAYSWTYRDLPDQGFIPGTNRGDHLQFASLIIDYEALRWLAIKPYANIQTRSSNYYGGNFNATVYGASLIIQWQNQ